MADDKKKNSAADDLTNDLFDELEKSTLLAPDESTQEDIPLGLEGDTQAFRAGVLGAMGSGATPDDTGLVLNDETNNFDNPALQAGGSDFQATQTYPDGFAKPESFESIEGLEGIADIKNNENVFSGQDSESVPSAYSISTEAATVVSTESSSNPYVASTVQTISPSPSSAKPKAAVSSAPAPEEFEATVVVSRNSPRVATEEKVSYGSGRMKGSGSSSEAQLLQAETLSAAQAKIVELERENETLREENELLTSAAEISKQKYEELMKKMDINERSKAEFLQSKQNELNIYRETINDKERELARLKQQNEELSHRVQNELKKIRVRERELENRLELAKLEKNALVKTKDESILELKRKLDTLSSEVESYQKRILELNEKIENNNEQFGRTVRALRLALTNLEVNEESDELTLMPLKKAE